MGKNKGQKSHSKQPALKGLTAGTGKARVSTTNDLIGCVVVDQGVRVTCPTTQINFAPLVLDKMQRSSSTTNKVDAHQVFDKLAVSNTETDSPP